MIGKPPRLVSLLVVALVACCGDDTEDEPGFAGRFEGTLQQGVVVVTELSVDDSGALTGTSRYAGFTAQLEGTVDGDQATGTSTVNGLVSTFVATLSGDTINWAVKTRMAAEPVRFDTTRVTESRAAGRGTLDPQLVGTWRRTVGSSSNAGDRGVSTVTDIHAELRADGTYTFGGATGAFTGTGRLGDAGGTTGAGATTTGAWKAEGGTLYFRADGASDWVAVGRYSLSGGALGIQPAGGGEMQLWERP